MGLDCSHDAFSGAYSAFNRFRQAVAHAIGGSYPPHYEYHEDGTLVEREGRVVRREGLDEALFYFPDDFKMEDYPGITEFMSHSDCDGSISPKLCKLVADELEREALPKVKELRWNGGGHIEREGGYVAVLEQFIKGCREAHSKRQSLKFR